MPLLPAEIFWFGAVECYFVSFVFRLCSEAEIFRFGTVECYFVSFVSRLCSEAEIFWFGTVECYFVSFFGFRLCSEAEIFRFGTVECYFVSFVFRLCSEAEILWVGSIVCRCYLRNCVLYKYVLSAGIVYNNLGGNFARCDTTIPFADIVYYEVAHASTLPKYAVDVTNMYVLKMCERALYEYIFNDVTFFQ
ncbi:unnamed protein product [Symbiodinium natans]|uniref:Uncharacterized protein n=1 Tax=Symbiodinium natans TaxID=878477 RepID=A0A812G2T4_9DINO|nr:unnamed protein product [Symbiodinium natans]